MGAKFGMVITRGGELRGGFLFFLIPGLSKKKSNLKKAAPTPNPWSRGLRKHMILLS